MSVDLEAQLKFLKNQIEDLKVQKVRTESNMQQLDKEKAEIVALADSLGVDPKQVTLYITELRKNIEDQLVDIKQKLDEYTSAV